MRQPSVLVEYPGPIDNAGEQDIPLYLRPESNGDKVESTIVRYLRDSPHSDDRISVVYLANLPGDFVLARSIVTEHYALRIRFAREGKCLFTPHMQREFERFFSASFAQAEILGSFEACARLRMDGEELFAVRVPETDYTTILGQSVKRIGTLFVVNYDIPAVLHKHNEHTDIFAMLVRTTLGYEEFARIVAGIGQALLNEGIVSGGKPISRVFHYSKGPFEQILDGIGYIYLSTGEHVPYARMSFLHYLTVRGHREDAIIHAVRNPLVEIRDPDGIPREADLFGYTRGCSYPQAAARYTRVIRSLDL